MEGNRITESKQDLKRLRIKGYFLDAAKEIIGSEGAEFVSVRKVADIAGYSYATLYNYFEDLNDLLWAVKQAMIGDLVTWMKKKIGSMSMNAHGIKTLFKIYMEYYLENPHVFKFFYFHKLVQPAKKSADRVLEPDFDALMRETFMGLVSEGKFRETDVEVVGKTCIYAVHGMMMLFFSGNGALTEDLLYKELDKMIDYLL